MIEQGKFGRGRMAPEARREGEKQSPEFKGAERRCGLSRLLWVVGPDGGKSGRWYEDSLQFWGGQLGRVLAPTAKT